MYQEFALVLGYMCLSPDADAGAGDKQAALVHSFTKPTRQAKTDRTIAHTASRSLFVSAPNRGSSLTPGSSVPCLAYSGDILQTGSQEGEGEDYEVPLWAEDQWTEQRVREAERRIEQQGAAVSDYWRQNYEQRGSAYWHSFYRRNSDHFYKDRHYLHLVFPELIEEKPAALLEVGCGVGNAVLPLLELNTSLRVQAIDCARSAIDILKAHPLSASGRLQAEVCDITQQPLPPPPLLGNSGVSTSRSDAAHRDQGYDFALCMFVLSALPPQRHAEVFSKLTACLRPGGRVLLRDYGRYDEAQLRFAKGSRLGENFYVRQDGTCAYFFSTEELARLAAGAGLQVEECYYIQRQYANRQQHKARYRVWLHAKFRKATSLHSDAS